MIQEHGKAVINEQWYNGRKDSTVDEDVRIVVATAKLIKANIREQEYDTGLYPCDIDMLILITVSN